MLSILRTGSAAPHSSWSPTVKHVRYSGPMFILRSRPTGTFNVPLIAAGERRLRVSSFVLGTTSTHSLCAAIAASISDMGMSRLSLMVSAWLWQRMEPMRTQQPSMGMRSVVFKILLVSATPFHSSFVWPSSTALSIHAIRLPARGAPKLSVGKESAVMTVVTARSRPRMSPRGSLSAGSTAPMASICPTSSRMFLAPAPEAAW
mmetsp:Transcript_30/g.68  ORF Transcript_30/g.68 Transcript_30/m.68 type:complete len:204 (-) Transcript_30:496-1107(-)